jgi:streptogrisin C
MSVRAGQGLIAAVAVALLTVTGGCGTVSLQAKGAARWVAPEPPRPPELDRRQITGSLSYLQRAYGVSEQEALRRLQLQAIGPALAVKLTDKAAASYAGMWMDQQTGRLVVAARDPEAVRPQLSTVYNADHIDVKQVAHSLAELAAARQDLAGRFGDGEDSPLLPRIVESDNQVVVWRRDVPGWTGRPLAAQTVSDLKQVADASAGMVVVRPIPRPNRQNGNEQNGPCQPLACATGPMRGGIRIDAKRDDGSWGGCTSGFNVRAAGGTLNGAGFVLTAGHCVVSSRHTHRDTMYHQRTAVLVEQPDLATNSFPYDYALLRYVNQAAQQRWLDSAPQHNLVLGWCRDGGPESAPAGRCGPSDGTDDGIQLAGVDAAEQVHHGWVVCGTGSASVATGNGVVDSGAGHGYQPGTRCGQVTGEAAGAIDTDLCSRPGDSGGPLFSEVSKTAIGILEGNTQARSGSCRPGETTNYIPVAAILDAVNTRARATSGSTFTVIATPTG